MEKAKSKFIMLMASMVIMYAVMLYLFLGSTVYATDYYSENFNGLSQVPSEWTVATGDTGTYTCTIGESQGSSGYEDDSMVLTNSGATPFRLVYDIGESKTSTTTFEFDFQYNGAASQVFEIDNSTGYNGGMIQCIKFASGNNIKIKKWHLRL